MGQDSDQSYIAFAGSTRLATGDLQQVAMEALTRIERGGHDMIIIFDAETSHPVDVDFRGTPAQVLEHLHEASAHAGRTSLDVTAATDTAPPAPSEGGSLRPAHRSPGRPKLGVTAKEVTLFPRHWEWLSRQPRSIGHPAPGWGSRRSRRARQTGRRESVSFITALAGRTPIEGGAPLGRKPGALPGGAEWCRPTCRPTGALAERPSSEPRLGPGGFRSPVLGSNPMAPPPLSPLWSTAPRSRAPSAPWRRR